jgi:hypothetical protein
MSEYTYCRGVQLNAPTPASLVATYCLYHGMQHGLTCPICADDANRRRAHRDVLAALESWLSDLAAENVDLRRRVSELEHRANDVQEAHNKTVVYAESMDERLKEAEKLILWLEEWRSKLAFDVQLLKPCDGL